MKRCLLLLSVCLLAGPALAAVRVFVEDRDGAAAIKYECTAGEVVRAFALDVQVSQGQIIGITNFFRGESKAGARGYGIFPAAFRDHLTVSSGTNANWEINGYTPLAVVADSPANTLPGLNSSGVTLEFGGLWDASAPAAVPPATGTLCTLQITEAAQVSVSANARRGGVVSASPEVSLTPVFVSAPVDPAIVINSIRFTNGIITISFQGGELEVAPAISGPWTGTGNRTGSYTNPATAGPPKFYRVHRP